MSDKQKRLQEVLHDLVGHDGIIGAVLVSRDGIRVMDRWKREAGSSRETFSAMSATLLGAAEIALNEVGGSQTRRVIADAADLRMVVLGCTNELAIVALGEGRMELERLLETVEEAARRATQVLTEGVAKTAP